MVGNADILLCCDLDRTVLPNGVQAESPGARPLLRALAARDELTLAYVSGRHRALIQEAIAEYDLPIPRYAVADVGTTVYSVQGGDWQVWNAWSEEIAPDWAGRTRADLAVLFYEFSELTEQEPAKQNTFKLSYYTAPDVSRDALLERMRQVLEAQGIRASLIWSLDEVANEGLLDVLPAGATKVHAVRFLMQQGRFDERRTVFAGDSGNDLPVLASGLQAVLVRNAHADVRAEARQLVADSAAAERLYFARGGLFGMNGNYSAGVLEGLVHFIPEVRSWLEQSIRVGDTRG